MNAETENDVKRLSSFLKFFLDIQCYLSLAIEIDFFFVFAESTLIYLHARKEQQHHQYT